MLTIQMEVSTRNYLVRLLENYKEHLNGLKANRYDLMYELNNIAKANASLMGKTPPIALNKNQSPINFGLGSDNDE